jgi:chromosome segregation ATPase
MSATMQLPKPEQMVDIVGHAAAVKLAMDGAFDDKIKELKAAQKKLTDAFAIGMTLEQAQKIKDDAEAYATAALEKAKQALSRAQDATDKVASREATVTAREQAVAGREKAADARQATQDTREESILQAQNEREAQLNTRTEMLKKNQDSVTERARKLEADIRAFNQKLEALKV